MFGIKFLWNSTRGHRFAPWRSDYVKWRVETYTGLKAEKITLGDILRFAWKDRGELFRYLVWTDRLQHEVRSLKKAE